jgi:hypothetical protein
MRVGPSLVYIRCPIPRSVGWSVAVAGLHFVFPLCCCHPASGLAEFAFRRAGTQSPSDPLSCCSSFSARDVIHPNKVVKFFVLRAQNDPVGATRVGRVWPPHRTSVRLPWDFCDPRIGGCQRTVAVVTTLLRSTHRMSVVVFMSTAACIKHDSTTSVPYLVSRTAHRSTVRKIKRVRNQIHGPVESGECFQRQQDPGCLGDT